MKRLKIGLALLLLLASQFAMALGDYEKGEKAFLKRDYATAVNIWMKLAESGHAEAQHKIGSLYRWGYTGLQQDYQQAIFWFQKSAAQGNGFAQEGLASIYSTGKLFGKGIEKDEKKAAYWYEKAVKSYQLSAEKGDTFSQRNLANLYLKGKGTAINKKKAIYWYKKAADQGDDSAKASLKKLGQ